MNLNVARNTLPRGAWYNRVEGLRGFLNYFNLRRIFTD